MYPYMIKAVKSQYVGPCTRTMIEYIESQYEGLCTRTIDHQCAEAEPLQRLCICKIFELSR
jgi:hypothetical protein